MPHPDPRCAHTEETGRSLIQRPHHLTTRRSQVSLSVRVSTCLPLDLWITTKGHAKLPHCCCTPTIQAPLAFAYTCMADGLPTIATPAGCMYMQPTVCPLLEPTDRHAGQTQVFLVPTREHRYHKARTLPCPRRLPYQSIQLNGQYRCVICSSKVLAMAHVRHTPIDLPHGLTHHHRRTQHSHTERRSELVRLLGFSAAVVHCN
jgi:DNA-directed RNA polymerase subunit RPC12/RpoP